MCDVPTEAVIDAVDAPSIYEIPLVLHEEGLDEVVCRTLRFDEPEREFDLSGWEQVVSRLAVADRAIRIGVVGKYVNLPDAYLSVVESLRHAGFHHWARVDVEFMQAEDVPTSSTTDRFDRLDGVVIPGGFGERGIEGKIAAARYAREHHSRAWVSAWDSR